MKQKRIVSLAAILVAGCGTTAHMPENPLNALPSQEAQFATAATPTSYLYVAPTGSDSNPGTQSQPLKTISAAASKAKPGMAIMIGAGTYYEQVITKVAGSSGLEIVFKSYNGPVIIDGSKLSWSVGGNQNQGLFELRHPYVQLEGLTIKNSKNSGVILMANSLRVSGCDINQIQRHGISTHTSWQTAAGKAMIQDIGILNSKIHHSTLGGNGQGQAISLIANNFKVNNNQVYSNGDIGIDIWLGSTNGEVASNTVYGNTLTTGIYVDGASYVRIHKNRVYGNKNGIIISSEDSRYTTKSIQVFNNVVYDNTSDGVGIWDPGSGVTNILFAYNTLINNKNSLYFKGSSLSAEAVNNLGKGTTSVYNGSSSSTINLHHNVWLSSVTGFVNPSAKDFHLTSSSTAINKGVNVTSFSIPTDFDGKVRTNGSAPDAGAYEY